MRLRGHGNPVAAGSVLRLGRGLVEVGEHHVDVPLLLEVDAERLVQRLVEREQISCHFIPDFAPWICD